MSKEQNQRNHCKIKNVVRYTGLATIALAFSSFIGVPLGAIYNGSRNPYRDTNVVLEYKTINEREKNLKSRLENERRSELEGWTGWTVESAKKEREKLENQLSEIKPRLESLKSNPAYKSYEEWKESHFTSDDHSCLVLAIGMPTFLFFGGCLLKKLGE